MPKQALPDSVRKNLGFNDSRKASKRFSDSFEIAPEVHVTKGGMEAKAYLKMKSGVPMSTRTSGLVAMRNGGTGGSVGGQAAKELHEQQKRMLQKENRGQQLMVVKRKQAQQAQQRAAYGVKTSECAFGDIDYNHAQDGRQRSKFQLNRGNNRQQQPQIGGGTWR